MVTMLMSTPERDLYEIQQLHDTRLWQRMVGGGPIAIVPLTAEGLAAVVARVPQLSAVDLRHSIMIPLQDYKKYNLWGRYFFVRYQAQKLVDIRESDAKEISGLLGDPVPVELALKLAEALGATEAPPPESSSEAKAPTLTVVPPLPAPEAPPDTVQG